MAEKHLDNHGKSVASWTAVGILLLAAVLIGGGIMINQSLVAWVGAALVVVGVIAGAGLTAAGFGSKPHEAPKLQAATPDHESRGARDAQSAH